MRLIALILSFCHINLVTASINGSCLNGLDQPNLNFSKGVISFHYKEWLIMAQGLTNQLYTLDQLLRLGCEQYIYVTHKHVKLDLIKKEVDDLSQILDITETNLNLNCTQIIPHSCLHLFKNIKYLSQAEVMKLVGGWNPLSPLLTKLQFSHSRTWSPEEGIKMPLKYYGIHFRMEADWVVFVNDKSQTNDRYHEWVTTSTKSDHSSGDEILQSTLNQIKGSANVLCLIEKYKSMVLEVFTDLSYPIIIATGLGKKSRENKNIEWVLSYFRTYLHSLGITTLIGVGNSNYRELNAASELVVMINSKNFIGNTESTFSQLVHLTRQTKMRPFADVALTCHA
eukprot:gene12699-17030_t